MQTLATFTKGILQVLVGAGAVAVDGYRKAMDAKFGHRNSFDLISQNRPVSS
jgi:hypothetical protein